MNAFRDPARVSAAPYQPPYGPNLKGRYASLRGSGRWDPVDADGEPSALWWSPSYAALLAHPRVQSAPEATRAAVLVGHLYAFNIFTEHLEEGPVLWVCKQIGMGRLLPELPALMRRDAKVIAVEECHHELISYDLIARAQAATGIARPTRVPAFVGRLEALCAATEPALRWLVPLTFVIASETLVTPTLSQMGNDPSLKSIVRSVLRDHAADELKHQAYFVRLAQLLAEHLEPRVREALVQLFPRVLTAYLEPDVAMIAAIARIAALPEPERLAQDVSAMPEVRASTKSAVTSSLRRLEKARLFDRPALEGHLASVGLF
jgi:hypothetical protein